MYVSIANQRGAASYRNYKRRVVSLFVFITFCLVSFVFCFVYFNQPREYVEFPSRAYPAAPLELEQAVRVFLTENGDNTGFSFRARKYSDDIFLIKASTDKSDGWGMIAQKQERDGQISWQIAFGTNEKFESLGIEPQW